MNFSSTGLIIIGVIVLLGVLLWRATGKSVSIRNSKGNIIGGNVAGSVKQDYKGETVTGSSDGGRVGAKEIVTWLIAILGVTVTALGVYRAWFTSHP
jgi:hypothetical protein